MKTQASSTPGMLGFLGRSRAAGAGAPGRFCAGRRLLASERSPAGLIGGLGPAGERSRRALPSIAISPTVRSPVV